MNERGFLLTEVLLTLLVVAAFGALAVSFRAQAVAVEIAARETTAVFLAEKRRAFVLAGEDGALADEQVERNGASFVVSSEETQAPGAGARGFLVRVTWQERGQTRCVCLPTAVDASL